MNRSWLLIFSLIILLASCAKAPPFVKEPTVFYPGPPDAPRIQFLRSFSGSDDLVPPKSAFAAFITGGRDKILIIDKPYGIAGYQGKIYVCDTNATVIVIDLEKKTFAPMEGVHGPGKLLQPINISIDKDGNKYVADPVRGQVVMFDKNDFYVKAFGPLEGWKPVDAAVFEGLLYVADVKHGEIAVFDVASGAYRNSIGKRGGGTANLGLPENLAIDKDGYLYVADVGRFQIVKLDRDGNSRGDIGSVGRVPGSFARPKGLALDRQDRLYAVDAAFNNIQLFTREGQLLLFFGQSGRGPGDLVLPAKVALDYDDVKYFQQYADPNFEIEYLILVTSQFSPRRVNVYGFGKEKGRVYQTDEELMKERAAKLEKEQKERSEKTGDTDQKKTGDVDQKKAGDVDQKKAGAPDQKKAGDADQKKD